MYQGYSEIHGTQGLVLLPHNSALADATKPFTYVSITPYSLQYLRCLSRCEHALVGDFAIGLG